MNLFNKKSPIDYKIKEKIIKKFSFERSSYRNEHSLEDIETLFKVFLTCIKKTIKTPLDIQIIIIYLKELIEFINMIKTNYYQNSVELLNVFSNSIKYIFLPAKQIIFKYGENTDNSYIILKGKINVLTPLEIKIMMSEDEYFLYLSKLINNDEQGLIKNCIHANNKVFPFDYNENSNNTKAKISRRKLINRNINLDDNTPCIPNNFTLEYIENSKPNVRENQSVIKKEVKIWIYLDVTYLKTGDFYEFSSLNQVNTSYSATLITQEDCHLGYMNKQTFRNCVREASEIKNNDLLNFLLSTEIFRKLTEKYFKSHYLNFFEEIKIDKHNKILVEGQDSSEIFFIKDGELEISLRKSLCEINKFIMYLGGEIQEEIDEENFMMKSSSNRYYKYMTEKNLYRISIVKNREILGLNDFIYDKKIGLTVECISFKADIYKIKKDMLHLICKNELNVMQIINDLIVKKKSNLLDRLTKIKKSKIDYFKRNFEKDYPLPLNFDNLKSSNYKEKTKFQNRMTTINKFYENSNDEQRIKVIPILNKNISKHKLFSHSLEPFKDSGQQIMNKTSSNSIFSSCNNYFEKDANTDYTIMTALNKRESTNANKNLKINNKFQPALGLLELSGNQDDKIIKMEEDNIFTSKIKERAIFKILGEPSRNNKFEISIGNKTNTDDTFRSTDINSLTDRVKNLPFANSSKDNLSRYLIDKLSDTRYKSSNILRKTINVVDCLALHNFNKKFSKISLYDNNTKKHSNSTKRLPKNKSPITGKKDNLICLNKGKTLKIIKKLQFPKIKPNNLIFAYINNASLTILSKSNVSNQNKIT